MRRRRRLFPSDPATGLWTPVFTAWLNRARAPGEGGACAGKARASSACACAAASGGASRAGRWRRRRRQACEQQPGSRRPGPSTTPTPPARQPWATRPAWRAALATGHCRPEAPDLARAPAQGSRLQHLPAADSSPPQARRGRQRDHPAQVPALALAPARVLALVPVPAGKRASRHLGWGWGELQLEVWARDPATYSGQRGQTSGHTLNPARLAGAGWSRSGPLSSRPALLRQDGE